MLSANLVFAEKLGDDMPLSYARGCLARLLASSEDPADWDKAEELASKLLGTQNLTMVAQARVVLARVYSEESGRGGDWHLGLIGPSFGAGSAVGLD